MSGRWAMCRFRGCLRTLPDFARLPLCARHRRLAWETTLLLGAAVLIFFLWLRVF